MCVYLYVCVRACFPSGGAILRGRSEVGCKMNKTRYRTLTTYGSHFSSPPTHISTHDTLETMYVFLGPSYNLHITNTGDSSYLPSISLLSLSTISTTDRKRRQRERPRLPTQKSSSRSSAFHSAASPADLLTSQPRSMRATAVSFSAFCASLAFYHATRTQRRFMPSMLSRRWHIFPPKKPVFEGWAACASGEWSSYQFRRDLDAPPSLPPSLVRNLTDVRVLACYPSGSAPGGSGASRGAHVPRGPCPEADGRRTGSGSRPPSPCRMCAAPAREAVESGAAQPIRATSVRGTDRTR